MDVYFHFQKSGAGGGSVISEKNIFPKKKLYYMINDHNYFV
jgi:hypothetical protein